jgi:hypothetical protein
MSDFMTQLAEWWGGGYEAVPGTDPSDYENINPYTEDAWNQLGNLSNLFGEMAGGYGSGMESMIASAMGFNPASGFNLFMSQAPDLQGLVSGQMSPLEQAMNQRTAENMENAISTVGNQFAGLNSLYSGGAQAQAAEAATGAARDAAIAMNNQQLGLTGQLFNNQMGLSNQAAMMSPQLALQGAGLYGNLANSLWNNQTQLGGYQTQLGEQNYVAPQYSFEEGAGAGIMDWLTTIGSLIPGIAGLF